MRRLPFLALLCLLWVVACGGGAFDPLGKINSVRVIGVRADKPYAKPGDAVTIEALAYDGRPDKTTPMQFVWLPYVCVNPPQDLYYACFLPLANGQGGSATQTPVTLLDPYAGASDGGVDAGDAGSSSPVALGGALSGVTIPQLLARVPPGFDLGPYLPKGPKFAFKMPDNVVESHPIQAGVTERYGLAIAFFVACAGKIEFAQTNATGGSQQVPIACTGADGKPVGANDYVFGFERIFAYESEGNLNPTIDAVTYNGTPVDLAMGVTMPKCNGDKANCTKQKIDVTVPESSWELNPGDLAEDGSTLKEQVWVSYFASDGDLGSDARLLYDTRIGKVDKTEVEYIAPEKAGPATLWLVVHDSRGGANWAQFPMNITE